MNRLKTFWLLSFILLFSGCIKSYDPAIDSLEQKKYVVSGRITDREGWQEVEVSRSSPVESPEFIPVDGCTVIIRDNKGHDFSMEEYDPGKYHVWIGQAFLGQGTSYKLIIRTQDGAELESTSDTMPAGPALDSVYYLLKDVPTSDPGITNRVMQFYVDVNAEGNYSKYYKWDVEETWEYEAARPIEFYYDGKFHQVDPPDYTNKVCWITSPVSNVFTVSTTSLAHNTYNQYPLHFVDGRTSRMGILYSMLVRQLALGEGAYNYWERLRINSNEQGGLYEKQPVAIQGNMKDIHHPDRTVLGYFYAASESSKRYFYHDVEGLYLEFGDNCFEDFLGKFAWREYYPFEYPIFYYFNAGIVKILSRACVDCRQMGGKPEKPAFWPK